jgi:hypothetical protein
MEGVNMHWIAILIAALILVRSKRIWSPPTQDDIDWAEKYKDLIERNS